MKKIKRKLIHFLKKITVLSTLFFYTSFYSQDFQWSKMNPTDYDISNFTIHIDSQANLYSGICSSKISGIPETSMLNLKKTNTIGIELWNLGISSENGPISLLSIVTDASLNVYISGEIKSIYSGEVNVDFDPSSNVHNLTVPNGQHRYTYIAKYDPMGNLVWANILKNELSFGPNKSNLVIDNSNNLYLQGSFMNAVDFDFSINNSSIDVGNVATTFILKMKTDGSFVWVKKLNNIGGDVNYPTSIDIDNYNNLYLLGTFTSTLDFDPSNNVNTLTPIGYSDAYICKLDSAGNFIFANRNDADYNCLTIAGSYILLTGYFSNTIDADPGVGVKNISSNSNSIDIIISKLDLNSNLIWTKNIGGKYSDFGVSIDADMAGNVYAIGDFTHIVDFDTSMKDYLLSTGSGSVFDMFICKLNPSGDFIWAKKYGNENNIGTAQSKMIMFDVNNDFFVAGNSTLGRLGNVDVNLGSQILNQYAPFVVKYSICPEFRRTFSSEICSNEEYNFYGDILNQTGYYSKLITGLNGCDSLIILNLTVNELPSINIIASDATICIGDTIVLTAIGANTYIWDQGIQNGVPFTPSSTYYSVKGTNTITGCSSGHGFYVDIDFGFTASNISTNNTQCSGLCNGIANIETSGGVGPFSYLWDNNTGSQKTQSAYNLCEGEYSVLITDSYGCDFQTMGTITNESTRDNQVYLTNIAAIDQINVSKAFSSYYSFSLPELINPPKSNPRNFVDPGKIARFKVETKNNRIDGQSVVSGIGRVNSNSPYITVTDNISAINNIGWGKSVWSDDEFEIDIAPNVPSGKNAYVDIIIQENGTEYLTTCIPIPIRPLIYSPTSAASIDDDNNPDSHGNNNDKCDPNEIIEFYPWLDNVSSLNAEFVRGHLENLEDLTYINIWDGIKGANSIVYDETWWNYDFAKPNSVQIGNINTKPEYDFVFNYNASTSINNFKLYMVMASGFQLFQGDALSLVQWTLPYTFNGEEIADITDNLNTEAIVLYPNPTNDKINIALNNGNDFKVFLSDACGRVIYNDSSKGLQLEFDISMLENGIYSITINTGKSILIKKFVKQ